LIDKHNPARSVFVLAELDSPTLLPGTAKDAIVIHNTCFFILAKFRRRRTVDARRDKRDFSQGNLALKLSFCACRVDIDADVVRPYWRYQSIPDMLLFYLGSRHGLMMIPSYRYGAATEAAEDAVSVARHDAANALNSAHFAAKSARLYIHDKMKDVARSGDGYNMSVTTAPLSKTLLGKTGHLGRSTMMRRRPRAATRLR
jgi:hypothetical protein